MNATSSASRLLIAILLVSFLSIPAVTISSIDVVDANISAADEPLSVILMIGDGMGFYHVELARLAEVGDNGSLAMQNSDWNASMLTYAANAAVTDSAAAGTAIATGYKTNRAYIGIDPSQARLENILEFAQTLNKSTGVVSTCRIVDATPASFMAHVNDRYNFDEITRQIVEEANVDVLLGGGADYFSGAQIATMISNGYSIVHNRTELANVTSGKVFGLFSDVHMDYEYERDYSVEPSIAEMTNKSIELLSQDPDGFFLMVEGGKIDLAAHDEDKVRNALDTIAFDKAVAVALDYVESHSNTILIVTADHETEGLIVMSSDLNDELPGSLGSEEERRSLRVDRANNVTVDWTATYHTDWPVPVYAHGAAFENLTNDVQIDNIDLFPIMKDFYLGNALNVTPYTPSTTTTTTTSTTTTTTTSTTANGGLPDSPYILMASIGVVIVVLAVVLVIKRR